LSWANTLGQVFSAHSAAFLGALCGQKLFTAEFAEEGRRDAEKS